MDRSDCPSLNDLRVGFHRDESIAAGLCAHVTECDTCRDHAFDLLRALGRVNGNGRRHGQPKFIGPHRVIRELGRGGMGIVYEAEQATIGRLVAVKITAPTTEAFFADREINAFKNLRHAGIAAIYEAGRDGELGTYLVMELIDGELLSDHLRRRDLGRPARIGLFRRIAEAVAHAHTQGVIHLDLKPDNILVDGSGQPKVLDFGLSRTILDRERKADRLEQLSRAGTLAYMSPERIQGHGVHQPTCDVYSLGVILYQMLTGRMLFDLPRDDVRRAGTIICTASPPAAGLTRDLDAMIATCLAKHPHQRYDSAAELVDDLSRMENHYPISVRSSQATYRMSRWLRRSRLLVVAIAAMLSLVVTGIWTANSIRRGNANDVIAAETIAEATCRAAEAAKHSGDDATALPLFEQCYVQRREKLGESHIVVALSRQRFGRALTRVGHYDDGLATLTEAHGTLVELLGDSDAVVGWCLGDIADVYRDREQYDEAIELALRAVQLLAQHEATHSESLVRRQFSLVHTLREVGRLDEAEIWAHQAVETCKRHGATELALGARMSLAAVLSAQGKYAAARDLLEETLPDARGSASYTDLLRTLAGVDWLEGDYKAAEARFRECLRIDSGETWRRIVALSSLAVVLRSQERFEESLVYHETALAQAHRDYAPGHPTIDWLQNHIATTRIKQAAATHNPPGS